MKKKFLSLLVLLSVPVGVLNAATVNGNYETAKKQTDNYITRFTMHDNYIEMGSNVPYSFDGTNSIRSGFKNGGLINKKEIELSTYKNDSYLFTGASYFTMTEEGNNIYNVNINKLSLVAKTEESGTRVTELVKPNTKVTGSGSRNNPWVFIRKFKVEFNGNTADSGKMDSIICDFGNDCALPKNVYKKTGYTFDGWSTRPNEIADYSDGGYANITNVPFDNVVVLYAKWKANNYNVVFDGNNHSSGATAAVTCTYNEDCTLPSNGFSKTGYTFKGWSTTKGGSIKYENNGYVRNLTPVKDATVTLYAVWEANRYTVKFDKNSSEATGNVGSIVCTYDKACTLPANNFTRVGATFDGWAVTSSTAVQYKDKASVKNLTATANGTYTLYAHWNTITYSIKYDYAGGSAGSYHPTSAKYGEVINISNPSKSCYSFTGWTISGYDSATAKSGNNSGNVNSSIKGKTTATFFKNLISSITTNSRSTSTDSKNYTKEELMREKAEQRAQAEKEKYKNEQNHPQKDDSSSLKEKYDKTGKETCDARCQMEKNSKAWRDSTNKAGATNSSSKSGSTSTTGVVTFTANWGSYSCGSSSSGGSHSGGSHSGGSYSGGSSSSGSSCDTRCQMEKNSKAWHEATTKEEKDKLKAENEKLRNDLPECKSGCDDPKHDGRLVDKDGNCVYTGVAKTC